MKLLKINGFNGIKKKKKIYMKKYINYFINKYKLVVIIT